MGCSGAFEAINKKEIDPLMKFDRTASIAEKDAIDVLKGLRSEIKNSLENENVWEELELRNLNLMMH